MDLDKTKKLIRLHEGLRQFPYDDQTGKRIESNVSIGYGRNATDRGIDINEAEMMLSNDLDYLVVQLPKRMYYFEHLDDVRQAVLFDMAYNIGINGLCAFEKMLNNIHSGEYDDAASELLWSKLHTQEPIRCDELIKMLKTGQWPSSIT